MMTATIREHRMNLEGFEKLVALITEKFWYFVGGGAAAAIAAQRARRMFRAEQQHALNTEAEIKVLELLRNELTRMQAHNARLEQLCHTLQLENIELRQQIGRLQQLVETQGGTASNPRADQ